MDKHKTKTKRPKQKHTERNQAQLPKTSDLDSDSYIILDIEIWVLFIVFLQMRIRTHQQCFLAKEFLDWLVSRKEAQSRPEVDGNTFNYAQELVNESV